MAERAVWRAHQKRVGALFQEKGVIAVGYGVQRDLKAVTDRKGFKELVKAAHPDASEAAVAAMAGALYRFCHEIEVGHVVVSPNTEAREVWLGVVTGGYEHHASDVLPHQRHVEWKPAAARTSFSPATLYEIGGAGALIRVSRYAEEFLRALDETMPRQGPDNGDDAAPDAEALVELTRDFIARELATRLKGHPFADFVAHLLNLMGLRTRVSPPGPDGGVDILAHPDELGFQTPRMKVQVKSGEGTVGDPIVSQLLGKLAPGEFGLVVTLGRFTPKAREFAASRGNIRLVDGNDLTDMVLEHYERLAPQYKSIVPLRQICVPDVPEEELDS